MKQRLDCAMPENKQDGRLSEVVSLLQQRGASGEDQCELRFAG